jgi:hypothetical protein
VAKQRNAERRSKGRKTPIIGEAISSLGSSVKQSLRNLKGGSSQFGKVKGKGAAESAKKLITTIEKENEKDASSLPEVKEALAKEAKEVLPETEGVPVAEGMPVEEQ